MPGGDGTGPVGAGPMTGRAAGWCAGAGMPGYANPGAGFGRGFGRGFGGGRGRRRWFRASGQPVWMGFDVNQTAAPDPEREKLALRGRLQALQAQLEAIRQRLDELDAAAGPA